LTGCFDWMEESLFPRFITSSSTFRPNTNKEFIHPYFEGGGVVSVFIWIVSFIGMMFLCVINLCITVSEIVGLPMSGWCHSCQESIQRSWRGFTERMRSSSSSSSTDSSAASAPVQPTSSSFFGRSGSSNRNGQYELVATDSNHGMGDIESVPSAPSAAFPAPGVVANPMNPTMATDSAGNRIYVNPNRLNATKGSNPSNSGKNIQK
jgi:hypothetical protein